ncbi:MAG: hypothetical protein R3192_15015 [Woeseiaceae bacterium]|nr:hypothetical protein [Woeseiaceae bacterium]
MTLTDFPDVGSELTLTRPLSRASSQMVKRGQEVRHAAITSS